MEHTTIATTTIKKINNIFLWAVVLLGIGIALGAFGAHGLKKVLSEAMLETFKTGVTYQMYHGLALLALGLWGQGVMGSSTNVATTTSSLNSSWAIKLAHVQRVASFFIVGVLFFSGNCYLYSLSGLKIFALLVPIGGISFLLGWCTWGYYLRKYRFSISS